MNPNLEDMDPLHQVVSALSDARKYRGVSDRVLQRVGREALRDSNGHLRSAVQLAKRRLHQIFGAFTETPPPYERIYQELSQLNEEGRREKLFEIMSLHTSTRERIPILEELFSAIRAVIPTPSSVMDLACGLNPLALPWMGLPSDVVYHSLDIDLRQLAFVGRCLDLFGVEHHEYDWDLVVGAPPIEADLAFLFKSASTLERQAQGAAGRLIQEVRAPVVVVSYPVQSLRGRSKGMVGNYTRAFEREAYVRHWEIAELPVNGELAFVVTKQHRRL